MYKGIHFILISTMLVTIFSQPVYPTHGYFHLPSEDPVFERPRNTYKRLSVSASSSSKAEVEVSWLFTPVVGSKVVQLGKFSLESSPDIHSHMAMLMLLREALTDETLNVSIGIDPASGNQEWKTIERVNIFRKP